MTDDEAPAGWMHPPKDEPSPKADELELRLRLRALDSALAFFRDNPNDDADVIVLAEVIYAFLTGRKEIE